MFRCIYMYIYVYSWSKSSLGFFCKILWTNPNELFGQPCIYTHRGFPGGSVVKNLLANAGDTGLIPESERSPGEGNDNPLQYSCLETPRDRAAWWTTVDMVSKSRTQLKWPSMHARTLLDNVILDLRTSPSGKKIFLEWFKEPIYLGWWAFLGGKSYTQHLTPTSAFQSFFLELLNQAFWVCLWHRELWDMGWSTLADEGIIMNQPVNTRGSQGMEQAGADHHYDVWDEDTSRVLSYAWHREEQETRTSHAKVGATMRRWVASKQISSDLQFSAGWDLIF